jgi:Uncharacterized protein conserved in bacteria (DUF2188)
MHKKNVWVTGNRTEGYAVRSEGADRAALRTGTQAEAIERGREIAKTRGVDLIVQGTDGQIRQRDSYGNDPSPPKG